VSDLLTIQYFLIYTWIYKFIAIGPVIDYLNDLNISWGSDNAVNKRDKGILLG